MREINVDLIKEKIKETCLELAIVMSEDLKKSLTEGRDKEEGLGLMVMENLLKNGQIAKEKCIPLCQDTGMVFVEVLYGQDVHFVNGSLKDSINQGVREAYSEGYLRKSVVADPLRRKNTGDNTPAIIHYEMVEGEGVTLKVMLKGFGSENMSKVAMLKPSEGVEGVKRFVRECVETAGGNPCPPIVVGVGIGGTLDMAAYLSKKALFRQLNSKNEDEFLSNLEDELLEIVNSTNVGPMGFGGETTALDVFVETMPTHIAGLPVAVNINCHSLRRKIVSL